MKIFRKKRPVMAARDWMFHWDNAPVHNSATMSDWIPTRQIKLIEHPPYSQDLAPADFLLFPIVKRKPAMRSVSPSAADMSRKPRNTNQPNYYFFYL
jgi:hypothetical protein